MDKLHTAIEIVESTGGVVSSQVCSTTQNSVVGAGTVAPSVARMVDPSLGAGCGTVESTVSGVEQTHLEELYNRTLKKAKTV